MRHSANWRTNLQKRNEVHSKINLKKEDDVKEMVRTGDKEVVAYVKEIFAKPRTAGNFPREGYFNCYCGFICPGIFTPFEVLEEIEFPYDQILEKGIYQIVHHQGGNTSHYISIQKWENGQWENHLSSNVGWDGEKMVNWNGIVRAIIQHELPLKI